MAAWAAVARAGVSAGGVSTLAWGAGALTDENRAKLLEGGGGLGYPRAGGRSARCETSTRLEADSSRGDLMTTDHRATCPGLSRRVPAAAILVLAGLLPPVFGAGPGIRNVRPDEATRTAAAVVVDGSKDPGPHRAALADRPGG